MFQARRRPWEETCAASTAQPPHFVQRWILFVPPAACCHRADSAVPVYHITSNHSPPCSPIPLPHCSLSLSLCCSLCLSEDHKWLHARSHLFDSPTGAFMSPFILSSGRLAGWRRPLPPLCLAQRSGRQPHAAKPFLHCYFSISREDVSGFDIRTRPMTMRPASTGREERPCFSFFPPLALIGSDVSAQTRRRNETWTLCSNKAAQVEVKNKSLVFVVRQQRCVCLQNTMSQPHLQDHACHSEKLDG